MTPNETWEQTARRYQAAPDVSFWMKHAISDLLQRDPVDAVSDVEALSNLMARRADAILEAAQARVN